MPEDDAGTNAGPHGFVQVTTTTATREEADALAGEVLEARLAACVQIVGPIRSRYWWKDTIETAEEWLCLAKTTAARAPALEQAIRAGHAYETPEVTATPVVGGSAAYLAWIAAETTPPAGGAPPPEGR